MQRWFLTVLGVAALALAAAGCDGDTTDTTGPATGQEPQSVPRQAAPGQGNVQTVPVVITADGVTARQVDLTTGQPVQLELRNESGADCAFSLGEYARGVAVPAGQTVKQSLTLPGQTLPPGRQSEVLPMGCDGDPRRAGTVAVEFKGLTPDGGGR